MGDRARARPEDNIEDARVDMHAEWPRVHLAERVISDRQRLVATVRCHTKQKHICGRNEGSQQDPVGQPILVAALHGRNDGRSKC